MPSSPFIAAYVLVAAAISGLFAGGFINRWTWRYVRGEPVIRGRSRCATCGRDMAVRDLLPVFGWLASKGRCRYCGAGIPIRYPAAELICAVVFAAIAATYGLSLETVELLAFAATLLFLSLVDIDEAVIPNGCIIAAIAVRAAYLIVALALGHVGLSDIGYYVVSGVGVGVVLAGIVLLANHLFGKESMGAGDLKLYFVSGLYFGWRQCVFLIFVSCVIGVVVGVASANRILSSDSGVASSGMLGRPFPFGPSIAIACVITMLVGNPLVSWCLGLPG